MPQFHAQVPTPRAARNMTRLCKHLRHKVAVEADERQAHIDFPFGLCRMHAQAEPGEATERLRLVIANHLQRFSGEEALAVNWRDGPLPGAPA